MEGPLKMERGILLKTSKKLGILKIKLATRQWPVSFKKSEAANALPLFRITICLAIVRELDFLDATATLPKPNTVPLIRWIIPFYLYEI